MPPRWRALKIPDSGPAAALLDDGPPWVRVKLVFWEDPLVVRVRACHDRRN